MYKLCGLNPGKGKFLTFLAILTVESLAATAFGMAVGKDLVLFAPLILHNLTYFIS